jgi:hypothetical protein
MSAIRKVAEYALQSRKHGVITALIFRLIPFFGWLSIVVMGLVTLRKGAVEGFIVSAWILLPSIVFIIIGQPFPLIYNFIIDVFVVWLLANALRQSSSWSITIQMAAIVGIVIVMIAHGTIHGLDQWWSEQLVKYMQQTNKMFALNIGDDDLTLWAENMAQFMTGVQVAVLLVGNLIYLLFARWIQAILYNPGGLRRELYQIRLDYKPAFILLLTFIMMWYGVHIAKDCAPVVLLPFALAGLSLVHCMLARTKHDWTGLLIFYGLLILFFPYIMGLLIVATIADIRWDFRNRSLTSLK